MDFEDRGRRERGLFYHGGAETRRGVGMQEAMASAVVFLVGISGTLWLERGQSRWLIYANGERGFCRRGFIPRLFDS
jgi:hypothetical protein